MENSSFTLNEIYIRVIKANVLVDSPVTIRRFHPQQTSTLFSVFLDKCRETKCMCEKGTGNIKKNEARHGGTKINMFNAN